MIAMYSYSTPKNGVTAEVIYIKDLKKLKGIWKSLKLNKPITLESKHRKKDGLSYPDLNKILVPLLQSPRAVGMEITILDPTLDKDGKYIKEFVKQMVGLIITT